MLMAWWLIEQAGARGTPSRAHDRVVTHGTARAPSRPGSWRPHASMLMPDALGLRA